MIPELNYLIWSVVLVLVYLVALALSSLQQNGLSYGLGSQDEQRGSDNVYLDRFKRSFVNFQQTYPVFIALALTLAVSNSATATTATGAAIWFWARLAYIPAYISGIFGLRSVVWFISIVGLLMMLWPLLVR